MTEQRESRVEPVEGACIWCKLPPEDAGDGVTFKYIDRPPADEEAEPAEMLCSACRGDLREFKRDGHLQVYLDDDYPDEVAEQVFAAMTDAASDVLENHGYGMTLNPPVKSNARGYEEAD